VVELVVGAVVDAVIVGDALLNGRLVSLILVAVAMPVDEVAVELVLVPVLVALLPAPPATVVVTPLHVAYASRVLVNAPALVHFEMMLATCERCAENQL
jgi:hypothetical protein